MNDESLALKTAVSLKGHDESRKYVVITQMNADFVLVADGRYRKLDSPKLKRIKHLKIIGDSNLSLESLSDENLRKALKD